MTASLRALDLVKVAAIAADSKQGEDLVALDVSGPLPLTDVFLLVTGRNERNVVAIFTVAGVEDVIAAVQEQQPGLGDIDRLAEQPRGYAEQARNQEGNDEDALVVE